MTDVRFGRNLKRLREEAGLTKRELAMEAGFKDASFLTLYEQGRTEHPSADRLRLLAEALSRRLNKRVTTDDFFRADRETSTAPNALEERITQLEARVEEMTRREAGDATPVVARATHVDNSSNRKKYLRDSYPPVAGQGAEDATMLDPTRDEAGDFAPYPVAAVRFDGEAYALLAAEGDPEMSIMTLYVPRSSLRHPGSRVLGLRLIEGDGERFAPHFHDGEIVEVEVCRDWFPDDWLVVSREGGLTIVEVRDIPGRVLLTPLDGGPPFPVDDRVEVLGRVNGTAYVRRGRRR